MTVNQDVLGVSAVAVNNGGNLAGHAGATGEALTEAVRRVAEILEALAMIFSKCLGLGRLNACSTKALPRRSRMHTHGLRMSLAGFNSLTLSVWPLNPKLLAR